LFVYVLGSTDRVEFRDWFYAADAQVEIIELDSGEMLDVVGLQQLSDVMTPHGNPDDAGFSVSATDQATIDAEIQAAWN